MCHDPDSYSWFLSTWAFAIVGIWRRRSSCSFPVYLFKFYLFSTWVGFPVVSSFLASSRFLLASSWFVVLLLVSAGSVGNPCGLVFLEVFVVVDHSGIFTPIFWTSRRACILAVFTAFPSCEVPARWRDLHNVVLGIWGK